MSTLPLTPVSELPEELRAAVAALEAEGRSEGRFSIEAATLLTDGNVKPFLQTDGEEFKNWFGASKVVKQDGTPKIVYHGTDAEFNEFEVRAGHRGDGGIFEEEVTSPFKFFSADIGYAHEVAHTKGGNRVVRAYLQMEAPLDLSTPEGRVAAYDLFGLFADYKSVTEAAQDVKDRQDELVRWRRREPKAHVRYELYDADGSVIAVRGDHKEGFTKKDITREQSAAELQVTLDDMAQEVAEARAHLEQVIGALPVPSSVWEMLDAPDAKDKLLAAGFDGVIFHENTGELSYAVMDSTQIKSADRNIGTFDPANPDIRFGRSAPIFYSALSRAIAADMPRDKEGRVSPSQAVQWINAKAKEGRLFKAAEVEWSGVLEYLELQSGKLAIADVATFVKNEGVRIHEVMRQHDPDVEIAKARFEANVAARAIKQELEKIGGSIELNRIAHFDDELMFGLEDGDISPSDLPENIAPLAQDWVDACKAQKAALEAARTSAVLKTKYDKYALPGGKDYRELLLTLPTKTPSVDDLLDIERKIRKSAEDHDYEMVKVLNDRRKAMQTARAESRDYKSNHWTEANVLVHVRFDERIDAEGKRVLLLQELQSDWAQDGRKKGFFKPVDESNWRVVREEISDEMSRILRSWDLEPLEFGYRVYDGDQLLDAAYQPTEEKALERARIKEAEFNSIPEGPFVHDTKAWLALGLKRMVRYAAEKGFDRVALINGQQSAKRYELSEQIDEIIYHKRSDGYYHLSLVKGEVTLLDKPLQENELADNVGKELADTIVKNANSEKQSLSGLDLKVGGEGMIAFYDQIVPQVAKDVLKKLGGENLTVVRFDNPEGKFTLADKTSGKVVNRFATIEKLHGFLDHQKSAEKDKYEFITNSHDYEIGYDNVKTDQTGFDITPAMVENVMDGMPMFSGMRSHATKEAFNRWFDGSRVTETDGSPKVVFHGTTGDFTAFSKEVDRDKAHKAPVFFFTDDPAIASGYANTAVRSFDKNGRGIGQNVMPCFLALKNPLVLDGMDTIINAARGIGAVLSDNDIVSAMLYGYDGAIVTNVIDAPSTDLMYRQTVYVAFEPQAIKSAIGNVGEYAIDNADIRFSRQRRESYELKKWFGDSKVVDADGKSRVVYHGTKSVFSEFGLDRVGVNGVDERNIGDWGDGFYFTNDPEYASKVAIDGPGEGTPNVMPVFLKITNPITEQKMMEIEEIQGMLADPYPGDSIAEVLKRLDYDGVIVRGGEEYVVFEPEQIRSAIGAIPGFDPEAAIRAVAFKRWFGDSRLVDDQGKPLVLFHGSADTFGAFDLGKVGTKQYSDWGPGIYLTPRRSNADHYRVEAVKKGNVQYNAAFARYEELEKNTLVINGAPQYSDEANAALKEFQRIGRELDTTAEGRVYELYASIKNPYMQEYSSMPDSTLAKYAAEKGHDGIIVLKWDGSIDEIVAFSPEQIKSATENNGSFDPTNPDIRFQRVWHGTPYQFDTFSLENVGTGEGAQTYGWGLYFAGNREVAEYYRETVSGLQVDTGEVLAEHFPDRRFTTKERAEVFKSAIGDDALDVAAKRLQNRQGSLRDVDTATLGEAIAAVRKAGKGQLYEVDIPDDGEFLMWDKPLHEQPDQVKAALKEAGIDAESFGFSIETTPGGYHYITNGQSEYGRRTKSLEKAQQQLMALSSAYIETGKSFYVRLANQLADKQGAAMDNGSRLASQYLHSLGIAGIKYLDGTSRTAGEGSHNYVVFDDNRVEMLNAANLIETPTVDARPEQTDLAEFRAWFGNSKVTDDQGKPVIAHHQTHFSFTEFDRMFPAKLWGRDPEAIERVGIWFTDSTNTRKYGPKNVDVYLSIQHPLVLQDDAEGVAWQQLKTMVDGVGGATALRAELRTYDHDGIKLERTDLDGEVHNVWIAFEPTQIRFADTPEMRFNRWFGDSKTVDESGKPRIVYHGTVINGRTYDTPAGNLPKGAFTVFDKSRLGSVSDSTDAKVGFWFTASRDRAEQAAVDAAHAADDATQSRFIYQAYLKIDNPVVLSDVRDYLPDELASIARRAKREGHDGVVFEKGEFGEPDFLVFEANQIKSAIENTGDYDADNPDIRFQRVWHGTPHEFETFSLDAMGTGEGQQAYGWGLYFAGHKDVAEYYRQSLTGVFETGNDELDTQLHVAGGNLKAAIEALRNRYATSPASRSGLWLDAIDVAEKIKSEGGLKADKGQLYEVEIPEDNVFMRWDLPLFQQSPQVKAALRRLCHEEISDSGLTNKIRNAITFERFTETTGESVYRQLAENEYTNEKHASMSLLDYGIEGVSYLDGVSRGQGKGTMNYVVFNDGSARIEKKHIQKNKQDLSAVKQWMGDSKVIDESGEPLMVFHGTNVSIAELDPAKTFDGGLHFGTVDQATMRTHGEGKNVNPVYLRISKPRRLTDEGGEWKDKIKAAKSAGADGIIYLNRYEGVTTERVTALNAVGMLDKLDGMSDAEFKKWVPEARDSYIVFSAKQVRSAFAPAAALESDVASMLSKLEFKEESVAAYSGQTNLELYAYLDGNRVGRLEYVKYRDEVSISMIEVPDEHRRNGYATALVQDLQRRYPETEIQWGMLTEDGLALYDSIPKYETDVRHVAAKLADLKAKTEERDRLQKIADDFFALAEPTDEQRQEVLSQLAPMNDLHDAVWTLENELRGQSATKTMVKLPEPAAPAARHDSIEAFRNHWQSRSIDNWVSQGRDGTLSLSKVEVPKKARGNGIGTEFMADLIAYADATGARITLTPSTDFGATSLARLKKFYKRFGFVENKGRNKDFSISETMYREPVRKELDNAQFLRAGDEVVAPVVELPAELNAVKALAEVFGSKVALFRQSADSDFKFNGAKHNGVIWLNERSDKPMHVVFGHELLHVMSKERPELYKALHAALEPLLMHEDRYIKSVGLEGHSRALVQEEMIADLLGDRFAEQSFWHVVAKHNPSVFSGIASYVSGVIHRIKTKLTGPAFNHTLMSDQFVSDLDKARNVLAEAVAIYGNGKHQAAKRSGFFESIQNTASLRMMPKKPRFDIAKVSTLLAEDIDEEMKTIFAEATGRNPSYDAVFEWVMGPAYDKAVSEDIQQKLLSVAVKRGYSEVKKAVVSLSGAVLKNANPTDKSSISSNSVPPEAPKSKTDYGDDIRPV